MSLSQAVSKRILDLCNKRDISVNRLAVMSCITQSTLQSIVSEDSSNPKLLTIIRICYGLNITLKDFFDDPIFQNIDLKL